MHTSPGSAFRKALAVALVTAALVAPAVGAAQAAGDEEDATDGVESSVALDESGALGPAKVPGSDLQALAGSSCKWVKGTVTYKSILGFVLYKYWEKQSFCYNGATVTALWDYSRGPSHIDATWDWAGHVNLVRTGGVGTGGASVKTEGHFKQCLNIPFVSCRHRYPWVRIGMDNSGAVTVTGHN